MGTFSCLEKEPRMRTTRSRGTRGIYHPINCCSASNHFFAVKGLSSATTIHSSCCWSSSFWSCASWLWLPIENCAPRSMCGYSKVGKPTSRTVRVATTTTAELNKAMHCAAQCSLKYRAHWQKDTGKVSPTGSFTVRNQLRLKFQFPFCFQPVWWGPTLPSKSCISCSRVKTVHLCCHSLTKIVHNVKRACLMHFLASCLLGCTLSFFFCGNFFVWHRDGSASMEHSVVMCSTSIH